MVCIIHDMYVHLIGDMQSQGPMVCIHTYQETCNETMKCLLRPVKSGSHYLCSLT